MSALLIIGMVTALAAAVRGNWSPCGESLQAQIHPLGERSRGNRWGVTVGAFAVGSMVAGSALAVLLALIGMVMFPDVATNWRVAVTAILAGLAGALDLSPIRPWTPQRQVNENWIGRYRGWVYGIAFGFQLGVGFAVFVMSWGYYAMLATALLSGSTAIAALIGITFGLGRGVLLYLSRRIQTPDQLARFHRRMAEMKGPVFSATAVAMVVVAGLALT